MNPARILIVDDEPAMLRAVERILGEYLLRSSASSKEAVELAKAFNPHLAIVDIRMPDMGSENPLTSFNPFLKSFP